MGTVMADQQCAAIKVKALIKRAEQMGTSVDRTRERDAVIQGANASSAAAEVRRTHRLNVILSSQR
jgi:hypothetical protein